MKACIHTPSREILIIRLNREYENSRENRVTLCHENLPDSKSVLFFVAF